MSSDDPNLWWRISCGHHQNLFDDATTRIEEVLKLHPDAKPCPTCGVDNCHTRRTLTQSYGGQP